MNMFESIFLKWSKVTKSNNKSLFLAMTGVVVLLGLWLLLAPALNALKNAEASHQKADDILIKMTALHQQVGTLKQTSGINGAQSQAALMKSVAILGQVASIALSNGRAIVTLDSIDANALTHWLIQSRLDAKLTPVEAKLNKSAAGLWSGQFIFEIGE